MNCCWMRIASLHRCPPLPSAPTRSAGAHQRHTVGGSACVSKVGFCARSPPSRFRAAATASYDSLVAVDFFSIWLVDVTRGLRCRAWLLRESREGRVTGDELQQRQQQQQADDVKEGDGAASATPKALVASKSKYSADEVM